MSRKKHLAWLMLAAVFMLTGCKGEEKEEPIYVALTDDIVSLDAAGTKDTLSETVDRCVYSTLYTFDEDLNLVPCLAEDAKRISDLEWEFQIKRGVKFHDGSTLTASDVKFTIERAKSIDRAEHSLLVIDRVEAPDDHTLRVVTTDPMANLPSLFVRANTSVMSEKALSDPDYDFNKPIGSGPFEVLERTEDREIRLKRFDQYFMGPAGTEYLTFVIDPSEQNSTASLLNGKYDVLFRGPANDGDYLKLNEEVTVYEKDSTKMELLSMNTATGPLEDVRVRKAIACAIDKREIVYNVLEGYGQPLSSMIPAPLTGFADFEGYVYDPDRAKELLEEAGYGEGFDLTVLTFDVQRRKLMEYLKLDLAKVNIRLNYEFRDMEGYLKMVEEGEYMASIMSWTSNPDPDSTFTQLYSKAGHATVNQSRFTDERVEELLRLGRMESDQEKRRTIYERVNKIVASSYKVIPLYQPSVLVAARTEITGVRINSQGIFGYESLSRKRE